MVFDDRLAGRVRKALAGGKGIEEKKMFGGLAFLLEGRMFCGVLKGDLMVRVGPGQYEEALARQHVRPMDFTGRPLRGFVFVGPGGCRTSRDLKRWVQLGMDYAASLPRETAS